MRNGKLEDDGRTAGRHIKERDKRRNVREEIIREREKRNLKEEKSARESTKTKKDEEVVYEE